MIGKICSAITPYYDRATQKNAFKKRPVLVIGGPRNNDYTVIPISTIKIQQNIDPDYDIPVDPLVYPKLNLTQKSYIRTHKQLTIHAGSLTKAFGDMATDYPELYYDVMGKMEEYNKELVETALDAIK